MREDVAGPCGSALSEGLGPNAQRVERWYCVSREGMATLCVDEEDARANAKHCDKAWPAGGPHSAVQLIDAAADPVARHLAAGVADHWRDKAKTLERQVKQADERGDEAMRRAHAGEAKLARLTEWMAEQGLLHYHDFCKRPDGTNGPAWVVRKPATVWGDACEAWHATSAAGAVDAWLLGPNVRANLEPTHDQA